MARLLFVTQTAHPWGGVEEWLDDLTAALAREHEVTVGLVRGRRFHDPARYRPLRVPTVEIPALTGTAEGRVRAVLRAIEETRADVVVPVNIADALEATRRAKIRRDVRLFYPLHGLTAAYFADARAFRGVIDFAIAANRLAERALIEVSRLPPERVAYGVVGVPPAKIRPVFDEVSGANPRAAFGEKQSLRLVYAGRVTQLQKRVRDLVPLCDAFEARGIDYTLDIVGDGDELPYLRAALAARPRVRLPGFRTRDELYASIYPGTDAMLILAEWETGPIAAWEAMRHGATIVTTAYRGLAAEGRLVDGVNALVAPIGDVASLADAVGRLASDPSLLLRLRRAAFETAERECSVEQSVTQWQDGFTRGLALPRLSGVTPSSDRILPPRSQGRLERIVGPSLAESIRAALGRGMDHEEPGGEWPHTFFIDDEGNTAIDAQVAELDRPGPTR